MATQRTDDTYMVKKFPAPTTEGQRLLQIAVGKDSYQRVATNIGARSRMNVFEWLKGTLRPAREMRAKIYAAYEIDPDAWDQRLGSDGKKKSLPAKPEPPPLDTSLEPPSALQDCLDVLAKLRAQRGTNLIASELTKLADIELKYHALRAKLEREGALREDKFVHEHPAWLRLKRVILDALAKHPEALRAVCTAIDTVQSTERSQAS